MNSKSIYPNQPKDDIETLGGLAILKNAKQDMLYSVYKNEPKDDFDKLLNERIKVAYKNLCGEDIQNYPTVFLSKIASYIYLYGDSSADEGENLKTAAKEVASMIGLNYIEEYPKDLNIRILNDTQKQEYKEKIRRCFLYLDIDLNDTTPKNGYDVVAKVSMLDYVGAGFLHLKNFSGAPSNVQNFAISLTESHATIGLRNEKVPVALGGNFINPDGVNYMSLGDLEIKSIPGASRVVLNRAQVYTNALKSPAGYVAVQAIADANQRVLTLRTVYPPKKPTTPIPSGMS